MLTDSVNGKKNDGQAKESIQVVDVSQLLLESVKTPADPAGEPEQVDAPEPEPAK
ncbi:(Fe-S)-binding protein OS=Streptomyces microflavus OX=1919 GN=HUT09_15870 PE=4 SV=1 [Streptomyces microflavus]